MSPLLANLYLNRFLKYGRITERGKSLPGARGQLRGRLRDSEQPKGRRRHWTGRGR